MKFKAPNLSPTATGVRESPVLGERHHKASKFDICNIICRTFIWLICFGLMIVQDSSWVFLDYFGVPFYTLGL